MTAMELTLKNKLYEKAQREQESAYLVGSDFLLHLKEAQGGDFEYAVFDKRIRKKIAEGKINADDVRDGIDQTHNCLTTARDIAIKTEELDGLEIAQVGLNSLVNFPESDIRRRFVQHPDTLPEDDIRLLKSGCRNPFFIPNGGTIQIEYPNRTFSARCERLDYQHVRIGSEICDIFQYAADLENNGGFCRPEPELQARQAAWKIGQNICLDVQFVGSFWLYHLYDEKFNEIKNGSLNVTGCSINRVRDMILEENELECQIMAFIDCKTLLHITFMPESQRPSLYSL